MDEMIFSVIRKTALSSIRKEGLEIVLYKQNSTSIRERKS